MCSSPALKSYTAIRTLSEAISESLPQAITQLFIWLTCVKGIFGEANAACGFATDEETAQLIRSLSVSFASVAWEVVVAVLTAQAMEITFVEYVGNLVKLSQGLPLKAIRHNTVTELIIDVPMEDAQMQELAEALSVNTSLTRLDVLDTVVEDTVDHVLRKCPQRVGIFDGFWRDLEDFDLAGKGLEVGTELVVLVAIQGQATRWDLVDGSIFQATRAEGVLKEIDLREMEPATAVRSVSALEGVATDVLADVQFKRDEAGYLKEIDLRELTGEFPRTFLAPPNQYAVCEKLNTRIWQSSRNRLEI